jgi:hypothetical protein
VVVVEDNVQRAICIFELDVRLIVVMSLWDMRYGREAVSSYGRAVPFWRRCLVINKLRLARGRVRKHC